MIIHRRHFRCTEVELKAKTVMDENALAIEIERIRIQLITRMKRVVVTVCLEADSFVAIFLDADPHRI